jgi:hypothetical protein
MALIECPECKNKVSDQADKCVHCGYEPLPLTIPSCPKCGTSAQVGIIARRIINSANMYECSKCKWSVVKR